MKSLEIEPEKLNVIGIPVSNDLDGFFVIEIAIIARRPDFAARVAAGDGRL